MIFQDPMSSLNPRHTIGRILTEPVLLHGLAQDQAAALALVQGVLDRVGLQRNTVERYSFELSGGQRQRVGIARAVVLRPDFVLADEIVSGLDVSTQAQVLRLLKELTSEMRLALAFISHDLSVVRSICQRVVVMREGRVVEEGLCDRLFAAPGAAYTRMLIDAIPLPVVDPGWLSRGAALEAAGIIDDDFLNLSTSSTSADCPRPVCPAPPEVPGDKSNKEAKESDQSERSAKQPFVEN